MECVNPGLFTHTIFSFIYFYNGLCHRIRLKINKTKELAQKNEENPQRIQEEMGNICEKRIIHDLYIHYGNYVIVCQFVRIYFFGRLFGPISWAFRPEDKTRLKYEL